VLKSYQNGKCKIYWDDECENAFGKIKDCISEDMMLKLPNMTGSFILTTDASDVAIGAVLSQKRGDVRENTFFQ
jgi:hypothetical protein